MEYSWEVLESLYRTMVRIRLCEESLVVPILSGEVRTPCHLYSGQEAIAAGICRCLKTDDYVFGNHRSHGHFLAQGGSMKDMVAEIFCKEKGCSQGRGGSMHLIDPSVGMMGAAPIVAGTISLAMGAALASSIREGGQIVVSFFGDGATGEGVLYESLNFAALKKLPVLFVCENNQYSTHMSISECRPSIDICEIAKPFGIKSWKVDGNNVLEVYDVAREATEMCRSGNGPAFMECVTYRLRGHVGPDDNIQGSHTDIRPAEEVEEWRRKDPISRFENYLLRNNVLSKKAVEELRREIEKEVEDAHLFAKDSSYPDESELVKYVFKE